MDRTEKLLAIEEIRVLTARYFRFVDTKQFDALPSLFMPDMQVVSPEGDIWLTGGDAFAASLRASLEHSVSCHQGFTAEIGIVDANNARGIWAMQDIIEWADRHPREGWKSVVGRGHYHETYRSSEGCWKIATLSLTHLRLDVTWPDGTSSRL